jgi:hypothetical protein
MKDPEYLRWVREQPCCVHREEHYGPIHAHHRTGAGLGLKASDHETMPLCQRHHDEFHAATGYFRYWDKQQRREWQDETAQWYRKLWEQDQGGGGGL